MSACHEGPHERGVLQQRVQRFDGAKLQHPVKRPQPSTDVVAVDEGLLNDGHKRRQHSGQLTQRLDRHRCVRHGVQLAFIGQREGLGVGAGAHTHLGNVAVHAARLVANQRAGLADHGAECDLHAAALPQQVEVATHHAQRADEAPHAVRDDAALRRLQSFVGQRAHVRIQAARRRQAVPHRGHDAVLPHRVLDEAAQQRHHLARHRDGRGPRWQALRGAIGALVHGGADHVHQQQRRHGLRVVQRRRGARRRREQRRLHLALVVQRLQHAASAACPDVPEDVAQQAQEQRAHDCGHGAHAAVGAREEQLQELRQGAVRCQEPPGSVRQHSALEEHPQQLYAIHVLRAVRGDAMPARVGPQPRHTRGVEARVVLLLVLPHEQVAVGRSRGQARQQRRVCRQRCRVQRRLPLAHRPQLVQQAAQHLAFERRRGRVGVTPQLVREGVHHQPQRRPAAAAQLQARLLHVRQRKAAALRGRGGAGEEHRVVEAAGDLHDVVSDERRHGGAGGVWRAGLRARAAHAEPVATPGVHLAAPRGGHGVERAAGDVAHVGGRQRALTRRRHNRLGAGARLAVLVLAPHVHLATLREGGTEVVATRDGGHAVRQRHLRHGGVGRRLCGGHAALAEVVAAARPHLACAGEEVSVRVPARRRPHAPARHLLDQRRHIDPRADAVDAERPSLVAARRQHVAGRRHNHAVLEADADGHRHPALHAQNRLQRVNLGLVTQPQLAVRVEPSAVQLARVCEHEEVLRAVAREDGHHARLWGKPARGLGLGNPRREGVLRAVAALVHAAHVQHAVGTQEARDLVGSHDLHDRLREPVRRHGGHKRRRRVVHRQLPVRVLADGEHAGGALHTVSDASAQRSGNGAPGFISISRHRRLDARHRAAEVSGHRAGSLGGDGRVVRLRHGAAELDAADHGAGRVVQGDAGSGGVDEQAHLGPPAFGALDRLRRQTRVVAEGRRHHAHLPFDAHGGREGELHVRALGRRRRLGCNRREVRRRRPPLEVQRGAIGADGDGSRASTRGPHVGLPRAAFQHGPRHVGDHLGHVVDVPEQEGRHARVADKLRAGFPRHQPHDGIQEAASLEVREVHWPVGQRARVHSQQHV